MVNPVAILCCFVFFRRLSSQRKMEFRVEFFKSKTSDRKEDAIHNISDNFKSDPAIDKVIFNLERDFIDASDDTISYQNGLVTKKSIGCESGTVEDRAQAINKDNYIEIKRLSNVHDDYDTIYDDKEEKHCPNLTDCETGIVYLSKIAIEDESSPTPVKAGTDYSSFRDVTCEYDTTAGQRNKMADSMYDYFHGDTEDETSYNVIDFGRKKAVTKHTTYDRVSFRD